MDERKKNRTAQATAAAALKAKAKRKELREIVRRRVFEEWCKCGNCKRGDYSLLCLSNKQIAKTLNTLCVRTANGKFGGWQVTSIKRLFSPQDFPSLLSMFE